MEKIANYIVGKKIIHRYIAYSKGRDKEHNIYTGNLLSINKYITIENIIENPTIDWDWSNISVNTNISIKEILKYPDLPWEWHYISTNVNISMKDIEENKDLPWDYTWLCSNPNINLKTLKQCDSDKLCFLRLSKNTNLTIEMIKEFPDKDWYWQIVSTREKITEECIIMNLQLPWTPRTFAYNPNITHKILSIFPNTSINFSKVSPIPGHTIKMLKLQHPHYIYNMENISKSVLITQEDIIQNSHIKWDHTGLSSNPNITLDFIKSHPEIEWDYTRLSYNKHITIDFINERKTKNWNFNVISKYGMITSDDVYNYDYDYDWNIEGLLKNTNTSFICFQKYIQNGFGELETNRFIIQNICWVLVLKDWDKEYNIELSRQKMRNYLIKTRKYLRNKNKYGRWKARLYKTVIH